MNYLPTGEETLMDVLIHMVDKHDGVAMAGFVSDGLGLCRWSRQQLLLHLSKEAA